MVMGGVMHGIQRDMVNEQAECILLECIFVFKMGGHKVTGKAFSPYGKFLHGKLLLLTRVLGIRLSTSSLKCSLYLHALLAYWTCHLLYPSLYVHEMRQLKN